MQALIVDPSAKPLKPLKPSGAAFAPLNIVWSRKACGAAVVTVAVVSISAPEVAVVEEVFERFALRPLEVWRVRRLTMVLSRQRVFAAALES